MLINQKYKTIHKLFEIQVEKTPNNTAIIFGNLHLTYSELNSAANKLAYYLHAIIGIKNEELIALYLKREHLTIIAILAILKAGGAYVAIMVPSYLNLFIRELKKYSHKHLSQLKLKILYSCGEQLAQKTVDALWELLPDIIIKNQYGPSETCMFTCEYDVTQSRLNNTYVPVGKPIKDTAVYILDSQLQSVSIGEIGELYIGGIGVKRGYLNNSKLNKEKFISNHLQTLSEQRLNINNCLYKSGDLARINIEGNIEYIGRIDKQVKINGIRLESLDIEAALLTHPLIQQATVMTHKLNNSILITAYYVAQNKIDEKELYTYLGSHLPFNMLPSSVIYLEHPPLTINGKLDKQILPMLSPSVYTPPKTELETKLCQIFAEVLSVDQEKVGIQSDFFKLGGNSILAMTFIAKIKSIL